ncbi:MAG: hypothetical protein IKZ87_00830 [Actinomycetaceae bacterium]|nr:hypothetical protein [Actinomycetaceae bacterium]
MNKTTLLKVMNHLGSKLLCLFAGLTSATYVIAEDIVPTLGDVAENMTETADEISQLIILLASVMGAIVCVASLYTMWRATKDEKERPVGAVVGLVVGGLLIAVPKILWVFFNTIMGIGV